MPASKVRRIDEKLRSQRLGGSEARDAAGKPARKAGWKNLHLDRPPVLYGLLMILAAIPAVIFHDSIGPYVGLGRIETVGFLGAVILAAALIDILARRARSAREPLGTLPLLLLLTLAVSIAVGEVGWRAAVATIVFGLLAVHFAGRLSEALAAGEGTWVERHWGGLGGALTGWHASTPAVHLAAALGFGTLLGVVLMSDAFFRGRPDVDVSGSTIEERSEAGPGAQPSTEAHSMSRQEIPYALSTTVEEDDSPLEIIGNTKRTAGETPAEPRSRSGGSDDTTDTGSDAPPNGTGR